MQTSKTSNLHQIRPVQLARIDNIYRLLQDDGARNLFGNLLAFKAKGYAPPNYPPSYLTFDSVDFIARHYVLFRESARADEQEILAAFKVVSLERCLFYDVAPTYYHLLSSPQAASLRTWMDELISAHRDSETNLLFYSGFTVHPQLRGTDESEKIKQIVAALVYRDHLEFNQAVSVGVGVPRFKTDRLWEKMGYERATKNEIALQPFPLLPSNSEPILLMKTTQPSKWCEDCYGENLDVLKTESVFREEEEQIKKVA